jgi:hypothetical protein
LVALICAPSALAAGGQRSSPHAGGISVVQAATQAPQEHVTVTKVVTITTANETPAGVAGNTVSLQTAVNTQPKGYRLTPARVRRIASADPKVRSELQRWPGAKSYVYTKGPGYWQVSWFSAGKNSKEIIQAYVNDGTGKVTQVWTGFQVAWTMARGYKGAFGKRVNALYVWLPMCLIFLAPFLPWPRRRSGRWVRVRGGWSLLHLDLLVLLGFSISLALFDNAQIGLSVPLIYPFLIYLMVRMLLLAFGKGRPRKPLPLRIPVGWLAIATVFLVGFRVGLNVTDSNVIDVGYAGVIGAHRLMHDQPIYAHNWPSNNGAGDTYGPVNYYAYVPAVTIFGWSGTWDDLPAAHAAAIAFDILTLLGLVLLGRRIRGPTLGVVLGFAWAAYPFSLWSLASDTNDTLVGLMVLAALLVLGSAPARGALSAAAGLTKFAPLALAPLFWRGTGSRLPGKRSTLLFGLGFVGFIVLAMLPVLLDGSLHTFWQDTISYQANRNTPFTVWGLWGGARWEQHLLQGAVVAMAIALAFVPRKRGVVEVAALAGALIIALQMVANYWLFSYIVWFFPAVVVGVFGFYPARQPALAEAPDRVDVPLQVGDAPAALPA